MTISGRSTTIVVAALCVSVLINLVAAGFFGVLVSRTLVGDAILRQVTSGPLPKELRQNLRGEFLANRDELRSAINDLRRDRDALHDALTADTFDRAKIDQINTAVRRDVDHITHLAQDMMADAASKVPADVRREIPSLILGKQVLDAIAGDQASPQN